MAKGKENEFTPDIKTFFNSCIDSRHLVTFVPWLHRMAEPTIRKSNQIIHKQGGPPNSFGPVTGSSVINLFHDGEFVTRAPAGKRVTVGKDVGLMATEVEGRSNASLLCVLHENWESFVKALYGKILFRLRGTVQLPSRERYHELNPRWRNNRHTPTYFDEYVAHACRRDCSEALKCFEEELDWNLVHMPGSARLGLKWSDAVKVLAFCRHCIVHQEGRVTEAQLQRLNKPLRKAVVSQMKETIVSSELRILPDKDMLDALIETMMSFAYGLYVLASKRCGVEIDFDILKPSQQPSRRRSSK